MEVAGASADAVYRLELTPDSSFFRQVSGLGASFQRYRPRRTRVLYQPECPTDTAGVVTAALIDDVKAPLGTDRLAAMAYDTAVTAPVWGSMCSTVEDESADPTWYYRGTEANTGRFEQFGRLDVFVESLASGATGGVLWLEGMIEFMDLAPRTAESAVVFSTTSIDDTTSYWDWASAFESAGTVIDLLGNESWGSFKENNTIDWASDGTDAIEAFLSWSAGWATAASEAVVVDRPERAYPSGVWRLVPCPDGSGRFVLTHNGAVPRAGARSAFVRAQNAARRRVAMVECGPELVEVESETGEDVDLLPMAAGDVTTSVKTRDATGAAKDTLCSVLTSEGTGGIYQECSMYAPQSVVSSDVVMVTVSSYCASGETRDPLGQNGFSIQWADNSAALPLARLPRVRGQWHSRLARRGVMRRPEPAQTARALVGWRAAARDDGKAPD
jgi:hypothetical protein